MADSSRIVFPDEAEEIKAKAAADKTSGGDTNDVEAPRPEVTMRNVVVVPPNCPPGHEMGPDGVCREIWKE